MPVGQGGEQEREVHLQLKHGVEAKNYDDVSVVWVPWPAAVSPPTQLGKAEKLKPMELELRRLEDLAESVVNDFAYMRAREEEMRDTNGELSLAPLEVIIFPHWVQSPPMLVCCTLECFRCCACCSWLPGRSSTSAGSSKQRNSSNESSPLHSLIIVCCSLNHCLVILSIFSNIMINPGSNQLHHHQ